MKSRVEPSRPAISFTGWCVIAGVLLCIFEGAARKWLLPNSVPAVQALMYFSKDVPLAIAVFSTLLNPKLTASPIFGPMAQLLFVGTVLVLMGSLVSIEGLNLIGAVITLRNGLILPWGCMASRSQFDRPLGYCRDLPCGGLQRNRECDSRRDSILLAR